jgi:hypothetical protein
MERRVELVRRLLVRRVRLGQLKRAVRAEVGLDLDHRTIQRYIDRARQELLASTGRSIHDHRAESLALYETILGDPESTRQERIQAQRSIDHLLGLPIRHPVEVEVRGEVDIAPLVAKQGEVARMIQALRESRLEATANGNGRNGHES